MKPETKNQKKVVIHSDGNKEWLFNGQSLINLKNFVKTVMDKLKRKPNQSNPNTSVGETEVDCYENCMKNPNFSRAGKGFVSLYPSPLKHKTDSSSGEEDTR